MYTVVKSDDKQGHPAQLEIYKHRNTDCEIWGPDPTNMFDVKGSLFLGSKKGSLFLNWLKVTHKWRIEFLRSRSILDLRNKNWFLSFILGTNLRKKNCIILFFLFTLFSLCNFEF